MFGTGRPDDITPSQKTLREEEATDISGGTLPTSQFFGSEETQEQVSKAQSFLSFGTVGKEDTTSGEGFFEYDNDDDDDTAGFFGGEQQKDSDDSDDDMEGLLL